MSDNQLISSHGGFRNLHSFQCAQKVYDGTVIFCNRFIDKKSRTHDQMVQAARSGVQNIAEGSLASATSKKTEIKLTSVARASLGELLLDYEDYLRQRHLRQWDKSDPEALEVRNKYKSDRSDKSDVSNKSDRSDRSDSSDLSDPYHFTELSDEILANTLICLINQASYLLWKQLKHLEQEFLTEGGFTERMYNMRKKNKN
jgi:four helix bundle suffix protein